MFHQAHLIKPAPVATADPPGQDRSASAPRVDIAWAWSVMRRRKMSIINTTGGALIGMLLFIGMVTPQYTALTQILIDPTDLRAIDNGLTSASQMPDATVLQVETQVRVLTSDNVFRRVVASEKLGADPEFAGSQNTLPRLLVSGLLGVLGIETPSLAPADPTLAALNELHKRVRVKRAERTYVVDVAAAPAHRCLARP